MGGRMETAIIESPMRIVGEDGVLHTPEDMCVKLDA
jgi:hypothetical protein